MHGENIIVKKYELLKKITTFNLRFLGFFYFYMKVSYLKNNNNNNLDIKCDNTSYKVVVLKN